MRENLGFGLKEGEIKLKPVVVECANKEEDFHPKPQLKRMKLTGHNNIELKIHLICEREKIREKERELEPVNGSSHVQRWNEGSADFSLIPQFKPHLRLLLPPSTILTVGTTFTEIIESTILSLS